MLLRDCSGGGLAYNGPGPGKTSPLEVGVRRRLLFVLAVVLVRADAALAQRLPCPEFQVTTSSTGFDFLSGLASDAAGNFVVVWSDNLPGGNGFGRRFSSAGAPLTPEFPLGRAGRVASDAAGNFVVVAGNFDGDYTGVVARRFDSMGNPSGPEFQVNTYTTGSQGVATVAIRPGGDFVVVWLSNHEAMVQGVFARRFDAAGVGQGPEFRVNTYTTAYVRAPSVAMDAAGRFTVVWSSGAYDGDPVGAVVGQRFDSGGLRLGPEFRVNTYTTYVQEAPAVASDPGGNVVVVWTSEYQDGDRDGIFGQRFDASGARLGSEFPVNVYTTDYEVQPTVAAGPDGSFLTAWTFHNTTGAPIEYEVFARRFEASGAAQGADFKVNTYTTGYQSGPLVAATGAGSFVVAWTGDLPGGSGFGVFARADCPMRFHTVTPCRLADTRAAGLPLAANSFRSFTVTGACGVPADAGAVALNAVAVRPTDLGDLRLYPSSQFPPLASSLNFVAGRTRANNALVTTGSGGLVTVQCDMPVGSTGTTHLVLDVYGYFGR
jgi:hypothetical protein